MYKPERKIPHNNVNVIAANRNEYLLSRCDFEGNASTLSVAEVNVAWELGFDRLEIQSVRSGEYWLVAVKS